MGVEAADGRAEERQAERAREHAQSRKRVVRQGRDARDRLTSTTGTKRSFEYELRRFCAHNQLSAGIAIALIAVHTVWVADGRVIITLIGWVSLAAGVLRVMWPDSVRSIGRDMFTSETPVFVSGLAFTVLGAVLCYAGYLR